MYYIISTDLKLKYMSSFCDDRLVLELELPHVLRQERRS